MYWGSYIKGRLPLPALLSLYYKIEKGEKKDGKEAHPLVFQLSSTREKRGMAVLFFDFASIFFEAIVPEISSPILESGFRWSLQVRNCR
jgi:hypothetical protein